MSRIGRSFSFTTYRHISSPSFELYLAIRPGCCGEDRDMIWRDDDVDLSELMISELPEAEIVILLSVFVQCTSLC